jgi:DNA-binding beta-propeller fold protein YncE
MRCSSTRWSLATIAALQFFSAGVGRAQAGSSGWILALSKRDHTLAIVDPGSLRVISRLPVGQDPHEVIASTDGRLAFVSIYGGGRYHALSVIDLVARKALPDVDTGPLNGPHGLAFVGGKVWFTAEGSKAIARYDPDAARIDWIMGTGQDRTHMIFVAPNERQVYTTNVASATVSILESAASTAAPGPRPDWNETIIPVGKGDEGFDVSPDGRELWTANAQDGTISIVDVGRKQVVATLDANVRGANRLKFTPNGRLVLISSLSQGDLIIYDAASRRESRRVAIGHGAAGILVEPNGARAFVACTPDNYVAVVDLNAFKVIGQLDVGGQPDGLAWAVRR